MPPAEHITGLVLSGGGARAAYQVGALRAIARLMPRGNAQPFPVICGTSAGAINAALLGSNADSFRRGVARLVRWWRRIVVTDVYRGDLLTLARHAARLIGNLGGGGHGPRGAPTLLDNAPLAALLRSGMDLARIEKHVASGHLRALGINATSYGTGHAVTFFEAAANVADWRRARRRGERCRLGIEHLMASTAIPFVFPAARVEGDYYMDGSVRQIAPLSPALHLGARRILVLAVGQFTGQAAPPANHGPRRVRQPSIGQIAGHALSSVFLDNLGADLERLYQINRLLRSLPGHEIAQPDFAAANVDVFVLFPSCDLGAFALRYANRLPRGVHYLLRGHGSTQGTGSNLLSYLLFDREFARALIKLGYDDAMARRDELAGFLDGASAGYVPLFPRELG
jgi:NTE family protein